MKASEFLIMMCVRLLAVTLAPHCNAQNYERAPIQAWHLEKDGHCLLVEFESEIVTNPSVWNGICVTNGFIMGTNYAWYYQGPHEDPFPRTSESSESFDVVSNNYATFILDNCTNRVAQASVKLGTIVRKSKTVITAATNSINSETFTSHEMNAKHFNGELRKVIDRGVAEGVFAGEMSFAEFIGVIEIFKLQAVQVIHRQIAAQEAKEKPIITPPNGFKPQ